MIPMFSVIRTHNYDKRAAAQVVCCFAISPLKWRRYPPGVFQLAPAAPKAPISELTGGGMPPALMSETLANPGPWKIRHVAYGPSNADFKLQCPAGAT